MSATPPNGNGKTLLDTIGSAVPVFLLVASIGGMALTPLYIMATNNSKTIEDLKIRLEQHTSLPSHPVMAARLDGEVRRLDDRISGLAAGLAEDIRDTNNLAASFGAEKSRTESKFVEVETQMDAMAQSLNIQFAEGQRQYSNFQNAFNELGAKIPVAPQAPYFFPNISNRQDGTRK